MLPEDADRSELAETKTTADVDLLPDEEEEPLLSRTPSTYGAISCNGSDSVEESSLGESPPRRSAFLKAIDAFRNPTQDRQFTGLFNTKSRKDSLSNTTVVGEQTISISPFWNGRLSVIRFHFAFVVLALNSLIACFDTTITISSHPVITSHFKASHSAAWLSTVFILTFTIFQPIYGRLSDVVGRKHLYLGTISIFALGTVWCALAGSIQSFILARAFCGLGAGGLSGLGDIMLGDLIPMDLRDNYQAVMIVSGLSGASMGSALGGAIADHLGWRWEFGMQVPGMIVGLVIAAFCIPNGIGRRQSSGGYWKSLQNFDFRGSFLLALALTSLILGINLGGTLYPWRHPLIISSLILTIITAALFIYIESRATHPILPLALLLRNPHSALLLSSFCCYVIFNAAMFNIPLFLQSVLLFTPTASGLYLALPSLIHMIVGFSTGILITRFQGFKNLLPIGATMTVLAAMALITMTLLPRWGASHWVYLLCLIPTNMGFGMMTPTSAIGVLAASKQEERATVMSALILWRCLGHVVGVAGSEMVVQNALLRFLKQSVTGPNRDQIIREARASIRGIVDLNPLARQQVVDSYAAALGNMFATLVGIAIVMLIIVLPVRMPKLARD